MYRSRRSFLGSNLFGMVLGLFGYSNDAIYKWSSTTSNTILPSAEKLDGRYVPPKQVSRVTINGKDVTNRCFYANEREGTVRLFKRDSGGYFYNAYIGSGEPTNKKDKEYAWIDYKGRKTFVEIEPTDIAQETLHGVVSIEEL